MSEINNTNDKVFNPINMHDLFNMQFVGQESIVENILSCGLYILAGSPKIGKSFLVLQTAYMVSKGQSLWGRKTPMNTVLYLALEDDYARLQTRLFRMFGDNPSLLLLLETKAPKVGESFESFLDQFMLREPSTKLIIIDTLQKVRENYGSNYSYGNDCDFLSELKAYANKHDICILLVHHTRKMHADDDFDLVSGTTGITGTVDGAIIMKKDRRESKEAVLSISGRDIPDQKIYIKQNQETLVWELDHEEIELWREPPDPLLETVASLGEFKGSPTSLVEQLKLNMAPNALTRQLNMKSKRLLNEFDIIYRYSRTNEGRQIFLLPK